MKTDNKNSNQPNNNEDGYPLYPESEDIYRKFKKEQDLTPFEEEKLEIISEKDYKIKSETKDVLDIPGAELDDNQEKIGSEDEENNYYSLGGDNHENLEEDNQ